MFHRQRRRRCFADTICTFGLMWRDLLDSCCNNIGANKILTENMAVIKTKVNNGRFNMTRAMNANIAPPPPQ